MNDIYKMLISAGLGFVLGLFSKFFADPILQQRRLIGEIVDALIYYANVYSNPGSVNRELANEASRVLRQKASQLRAGAHTIPVCSFWAIFRLVPSYRVVDRAARELIGLSNSVHQGDSATNHHRVETIAEALKIRLFL